MKKFLFALMGLVVAGNALGDNLNICGPKSVVSFDGIQGPDDNEFIFIDKASYDAAVKYKRNDEVRVKGVWECDNKHCQRLSQVTAPAGHVFKGEVVNKEVKYQCKYGGLGLFDDKWIVINDGCIFNGEALSVGETKSDVSYMDCLQAGDSVVEYPKDALFTVECVEASQLKCYPNTNNDDVVGPGRKDSCELSGGLWNGNACSCSKDKHIKPDSSNMLCECEGAYDWKSDRKQGCYKKQIPVPTPVLNCEESRSTPEGKACCKIDQSVATWQNNKCVCNNGGEFVYSGVDTPYCKEKDGGTAPVVEPEIDSTQYENAEIDEVYAEIKGLESKYAANISKWKNEEGNFNTARLVSDSIAGVVLGTVGSVVTSTVIKKNQIEDGFEDLKCAIGGQTVATWGDEFVVGVQ